MRFVFPAPPVTSVPIAGSELRFPVHRVYCVARNYAAHAREMGMDPGREPPFFFAKPADALVTDCREVPYPPRTRDLQHEVELVVAIGTGGAGIARSAAPEHVFGYAVGNDLTRRDLQRAARERGHPWDVAKGFDHSAPIGALHRVAKAGHPARGEIGLEVNGKLRQRADLSELIWSVPELIAELSTLFTLAPGDLIFTGTPAGVGPVVAGDLIEAYVEGLDRLMTRIV